MPNIKSAIKRMHTSRAKALQNKSEKSALKTVLKKVNTAIAAKKKDEANELFKSASSLLDRAAKKNIIHKNNAARKKARLSCKIDKI